MRKLLDGYIESGCKIVRAKGKNPNLLIIGKEHTLNTYVSPEELFREVKPEYFFCEGVKACLEMDFTKYQTTHINEDTFGKDETFEALIHGTLYDIGTGYAGLAITEWFPQNPSTTFVGIDLEDKTIRSNKIVELYENAIEKLEDYPAEMLHLRSSKLTDEQYQCYETFRDFLYDEISHATDAYSAVRDLEKIRKNAPSDVFNKSGARALFSKIKKETKQFNYDREVTMGKTITEYVSKAIGLSLAVVGAYHIRRNSHLYTSLDSNSIDYLAVKIF